MPFDIKPNDRFLQEQRTFYRTNTPKDEIRDEMIIRRARHDNLSAGDEIVIQSFNHEKTVLLHEAAFRVTMRTDMPDSEERENGDIRQFTRTTFKIERVGDWWASEAAREAEPEKPGAEESDALAIVWNLGKKVHQLKQGDEVVFESADKAEAETKLAELQEAA